MTRRAFWVGVCLSAAIALWGTAGQVFAGPKAGHTSHGKAHMQQAARGTQAHGNAHSSGSGAAMAGATTNTSSGSSPVGNNGTVKIDNYTDRNSNDIAHNNEPHVSCAWGVDAYGYEFSSPVGVEAFQQHSPTPGIGGKASPKQMDALANTNPRGNGATYNGSTTNELVLVGSPHPKQGYHVKLTYTAPDGNSNGSMLKHKVFWVQSCGSTPPGGGRGGNGGGGNGGGQGSIGTTVTTTSVLAMHAAASGATTARPGQAVAAQPGFTG